MIRVSCPHCSKALGLPPTAAGKTVKCPNCKKLFAAPGVPVKAAAKPAVAPSRDDDEFGEATPYGVKHEVDAPAAIRKSATVEAVDAMVVDARRSRKRNRAWDMVGLPAKYIKRFALMAVILWIFTYLFMTMIIVLCNHNMEIAEKGDGYVMNGGVKELPKYIFLTEWFGIKPQMDYLNPLSLWLYSTGALLVALFIYGLQLAGAESMKRLENFQLSLFSMIVGALSINLFGIWGLLALMDKGVQYEFRVSARRKQGLSGEDLYREDDDDEEDEDEEDEEDEEEEEAAARPAQRRG
jgi:hypothetical protein